MATKTSARPTAAQRSIAAREARARKIMRGIAIPATAVIASVALWNSYFHITQLAMQHGQSSSAGHLTPVAIDGLMLVASVAMVANRTAWIPRLAFATGAALTLGANIASVHHHDAWGYVLAGTPAIALIGAAEMLLRLCLPAVPKRHRPVARKAPAKAAQSDAKAPVRPARTRAGHNGTAAPVELAGVTA